MSIEILIETMVQPSSLRYRDIIGRFDEVKTDSFAEEYMKLDRERKEIHLPHAGYRPAPFLCQAAQLEDESLWFQILMGEPLILERRSWHHGNVWNLLQFYNEFPGFTQHSWLAAAGTAVHSLKDSDIVMPAIMSGDRRTEVVFVELSALFPGRIPLLLVSE